QPGRSSLRELVRQVGILRQRLPQRCRDDAIGRMKMQLLEFSRDLSRELRQPAHPGLDAHGGAPRGQRVREIGSAACRVRRMDARKGLRLCTTRDIVWEE